MTFNDSHEKRPAILAVVQGNWVKEAYDYFNNGGKILYFCTNSGIKQAISLRNIQHVYFKCKGESCISFKADFVDCTEINPRQFRLPGSQGIDGEGKYYYGFKRLVHLNSPVELTDLSYYTTGNKLINSVPGSRIIIDPYV
jgi:hypothetical protein